MWYDIEHTTKAAKRMRCYKDLIERMLTPEGACSNHTAQAMTLPMFIDALVKAGRSFNIHALGMDGRIVGYYLTTKPEDFK